jgi:hypothetical protein
MTARLLTAARWALYLTPAAYVAWCLTVFLFAQHLPQPCIICG